MADKAETATQPRFKVGDRIRWDDGDEEDEVLAIGRTHYFTRSWSGVESSWLITRADERCTLVEPDLQPVHRLVGQLVTLLCWPDGSVSWEAQ